MKVLLILSDGMRPDSLKDIPLVNKLKRKGTYCMNAKTVTPSVTLPCHMSLFHSVDPDRHGILTNTYMPQVRPISGLCEQLKQKGKKCAMYYNWEEIRDISRPGSLCLNKFHSGYEYGLEASNAYLCDCVKKDLNRMDIDFAFLYLLWVDEAGHANGWMSEPYMEAVRKTCSMIEDVIQSVEEKYTVILTADHGGHDRMHGTDCAEDMTIPVFLYGNPFEEKKELSDVSIKDIAPTIAGLLGADCAPEWEGKCLK